MMKQFFIIALIACSLSAMTGQQANRGPKRYRVSGILLLLNFDGLRVDVVHFLNYIKDGHTIGDMIRNADFFFGNSELKGKVSIKLPDGQQKTIMQMDEFTEYSYAQPVYFSFEYEGSKETSFEISCDLEEFDDGEGENDQVCIGSKIYKAQSSIFGRQRMNDTIKKSWATNGDNIDLIINMANQMGYDKIWTNEGSKDLRAVIERLNQFKEEIKDAGYLDMFLKFQDMLADIGGAYLMNLNIEKIEKGPGSYKRIEDSWAVVNSDSTNSDKTFQELYGQLYILPQASTINLANIAATLGIKIPEKIEHFFSDFELPLLNGPAIPLFDLPRAVQRNNGFEIQQDRANRFSAYFKSKEDKEYIVFVNLWDTDGEGSFVYDDCFAKGTAFGLEKVDFTGSDTFKFPQCDNKDNEYATMHRNSPITIDDESNLVEYHLSGVFYFYCSDDYGGYYDPYGKFHISVGNRKINQNFVIWEIPKSNYLSVKNKSPYMQPFTVRFRESVTFLKNVNYVTLHGGVWEDDDNDDDIIGEFNDHQVPSSVLTATPSTFKFPGNDDYEVKVTMQLTPLSGDVVELVTYVISGTLSIFVSADKGGTYEPYGNLNIDIGNRVENQNIQFWYVGADDIEVENGKTLDVDLGRKEFKELENFVDSSQTVSFITLHGQVKESDNNADDDIGLFDEEKEKAKFKPSDLFGKEVSRKFTGDDDYYAQVTLKVERKSSSDSSKAREEL